MGVGDAARSDRKPGDLLDPETPLELAPVSTYVSRGGEKLAGALDAFAVDPSGRVCLDVGASTGGFTDVLLRRGATRVYALDVGRGQLAESLRGDPRVISMERTHAGRLDPTAPDAIRLPEPPSLAVIDVSFISLTRILRGVAAQLVPGGEIVALVKPQFEAGRQHVGKGGVVRDPRVHAQVLRRLQDWSSGQPWRMTDTLVSPIKGPAGNVEFLSRWQPGA